MRTNEEINKYMESMREVGALRTVYPKRIEAFDSYAKIETILGHLARRSFFIKQLFDPDHGLWYVEIEKAFPDFGWEMSGDGTMKGLRAALNGAIRSYNKNLGEAIKEHRRANRPKTKARRRGRK